MENKKRIVTTITEHGTGTIKQQLEAARKIREQQEKYDRIVNAGIAKWIKEFQAGNIQFKSVDDLKKLVEISIMLQKLNK